MLESDIDWTLFNTAHINTTTKLHTFGIKWRNNLLPILKLEHIIKRVTDPACPAGCGCQSENHWHLLTCPSKPRRQSWTAFRSKLSEIYNKHHLDPGLQKVLHNLLTPFGEPSEALELSSSYQDLYTSQLRLGKRSPFLGLFVNDWQRIQHDFLKLNHLPYKQQQALHVLKLIARALLQQVLDIWNIRNDELHKNDPKSKPAHQHHLLQQKVTEIYSNKHQLQHIDRQLLDMPLAQRLTHSTQQLSDFVDYITPIITNSIKLAKEDDKKNTLKLKDYLQATHTNTLPTPTT